MQTQKEAFLKELGALWPLAKGALTQVRKPCIRPNCPQCASGEKHRAYFFTYRARGRQHCRYVPVALVGELRRALANGQKLQQRLALMGEALIQTHRKSRVKKSA